MATSDPDLKQMLQAQMRLMETLTAHLSSLSASSATRDQPSIDHIGRNIPEFIYDSDAGVTFDSWFKRHEDVFSIELSGREDVTKVRLLLRKLGPAEHVRYSNYILPAEPLSKSFDDTISTLKKIFGDNSSLFNTRFHCLQLVKRDVDDFVTYAGIVNKECSRFQLGTLSEDQFRCLIFICGLQSPGYSDIRTRLLQMIDQQPLVKLQQIVEECERLISLKRDSALIQQPEKKPQVINAVSSTKPAPNPVTPKPNSQPRPPYPCRLCGDWHFHRLCPFRQHRCQKCGQLGHKEGFCKRIPSPNKTENPPKPRRWFPPRPKVRSNALLTTFQLNASHRRKFVTVCINGIQARLQLDTASDITIISRKLWSMLGKPTIEPSSLQATSACGGSVHLVGLLRCSVSFRDTTYAGVCYICESGLDLLGLDWLEQLGMLDLPIRLICNHVHSPEVPLQLSQQLVKQFAAVFRDELGLCTSTQATLHPLPDCRPVFRPKRPVPYAALPLLEQELTRLEQSGVIVPVSYSAWAAPIVVVKKANGTIRVCGDFSTGLNAALKTHCYPLPLPEDIFTMLNGGTYFAKLDLADAYFQIEVAPESRELLTINTHRGLFQYTRLPFGVKTAPAIFQQVIDTIISGLLGTAAYMDDVILMGRSADELKERIAAVLKRFEDHGLRLRPDKCQFFLSSIKYLGYIFDAKGRHPDPENIRAIQRMPPPSDVTTLRSFLGLVSYYSAFLPALHNARAPLNRLLQKDSSWNWSSECERAFVQLKSMLSSDLLLTHYDPSFPIVVAADASNYGVGAVISHVLPDGTEKPVAHVSRTLNAAEKNYGQIEKEALAIIFAVKKFHKYLWGRRFTLLTDHKPLLSIFGSKKGIPVYSANRLQRWATILLGYDFSIQYRHTESFGQADGLSRLIQHKQPEAEDLVIASMAIEEDTRQQLSDAIRGIPVTAADIKCATASDPILCQVVKYTRTHWPPGPFTGELHQFFCRRDSLAVVDSCLMFSDRVVVPAALRPIVLRQFHSGHPGISRMKAVARSYAYWPGMDNQIADVVKQCSSCQQAAKLPAHHEPVPWEQPTRAWSRLHIDFAGPLKGIYYLVVVDAYSKWPEVIPMQTATTGTTIAALRRIFGQHGLPDTIVSDNGTQFSSAQFKDFCIRAGIQHIHSPPYHPQSNGQAERFVDTFKRALLKSRGEGNTEEILQEFLLAYRTTPSPTVPEGRTPAEALMGRKLRTVHSALIPVEPLPQLNDQANQGGFTIGSTVYARDYRPGKENWAEATIASRRGKVLYDVKVGDDVWVRHKNQMRGRCGPSTTTIPHRPLPLDVLLDTFNIPMPQGQSAQPRAEEWAINLQPRRWSTRPRRSIRPLEVNPRNKQYR